MTEHERLFNIYLRYSGIYYRENPQMIIPSTELWEVVSSLKPFEAPDMYAKIGNKVYILEHFSFDASKETSKGMAGQREEQKLEARISGIMSSMNGKWIRLNILKLCMTLKQILTDTLTDIIKKSNSTRKTLLMQTLQ